MESLLLDRFATLSHPMRMAIFRLLMRRCPDALPAGEIAAALHLKASTASVHLAALTRVGLITQRRAGTRLLYAVSLDAARAVVSGLFVDCCRGRADLCPPQLSDLVTRSAAPPSDKRHVLFVCTGNSARSILAESILRDMAEGRFTACSAGTAPRPQIHPMAIDLLTEKGHDTRALRSKSLAQAQQDAPRAPDFVITVCDSAANEDTSLWPHRPFAAHWGMPDPARAQGPAQTRRAFEQTYDLLHHRITSFTTLPFESLSPAAVQARLDTIGTHIPDRSMTP